jgi:hypothetical protein
MGLPRIELRRREHETLDVPRHGQKLECGGNGQGDILMAANKVKQRAKTANTEKPPTRKTAVRPRRRTAKGPALSPLDRPGEAIVDAARHRWLSAEGSATSRVVSQPGSVRRLGSSISR